MRALQLTRPDLHLFGIGGAALRTCGMEANIRAEDMALAGLTEVLCALPRMWRNLRHITRLAAERRPVAAYSDRSARFHPAARTPSAAHGHPGDLLHQSASVGLARRPGSRDPRGGSTRCS